MKGAPVGGGQHVDRVVPGRFGGGPGGGGIGEGPGGTGVAGTGSDHVAVVVVVLGNGGYQRTRSTGIDDDGPMPPVALPIDLTGPVTVAPAKATPAIPEAGALPGGCVYELKWDGFGLVVVITSAGSRLWTRQGTDLTDRLPKIPQRPPRR